MRTMITLGFLVLVLLAGVQGLYGQGNATIVGVVSDSTINLTAEQISSVKLTLEIGDVKESIEVSGAAPRIMQVGMKILF